MRSEEVVAQRRGGDGGVMRMQACGGLPCPPHPTSLRSATLPRGGGKSSGRVSSSFRCERVWGSRRSLGGCPEPRWPPAFALRGPIDCVFGSRRRLRPRPGPRASPSGFTDTPGGPASPPRRRPATGPGSFGPLGDRPATGGRLRPAGLRGFTPLEQSRYDRSRRTSGSWAQDAFPNDGMAPIIRHVRGGAGSKGS